VFQSEDLKLKICVGCLLAKVKLHTIKLKQGYSLLMKLTRFARTEQKILKDKNLLHTSVLYVLQKRKGHKKG
jgi:hypothetical protein